MPGERGGDALFDLRLDLGGVQGGVYTLFGWLLVVAVVPEAGPPEGC